MMLTQATDVHLNWEGFFFFFAENTIAVLEVGTSVFRQKKGV